MPDWPRRVIATRALVRFWRSREDYTISVLSSATSIPPPAPQTLHGSLVRDTCCFRMLLRGVENLRERPLPGTPLQRREGPHKQRTSPRAAALCMGHVLHGRATGERPRFVRRRICPDRWVFLAADELAYDRPACQGSKPGDAKGGLTSIVAHLRICDVISIRGRAVRRLSGEHRASVAAVVVHLAAARPSSGLSRAVCLPIGI